MARGGVNTAIIKKARQALLARGENPSIDAIRVELGNTGSKTTIHRCLKELEEAEPSPQGSTQQLSDELSDLVARLLTQLQEEAGVAIAQAQAQFDRQRTELHSQLDGAHGELAALQRQFDSQDSALIQQSSELKTCHSSLQTEITRNARLSQSCADLEVRVQEKDEHIRSLEEKHLHARDALEHYRTAAKEQREQEQRRHEGQLQQIQVQMRQLQQLQAIKQDELTRLNRDNERLLSEARQHAKAAAGQEDALRNLRGEIDVMKAVTAKADGVNETLRERIDELTVEGKRLAGDFAAANERVAESGRALIAVQGEIALLRAASAQALPITDQ